MIEDEGPESEAEEDSKFRCKHYKRKCQFVVSCVRHQKAIPEQVITLYLVMRYANMQVGGGVRCDESQDT